MKRQKSYRDRVSGTLYLIPTPIGNLEDITLRGIRLLKESDYIASEDTRNTQKLLNHFEITTPQMSFHDHNYREKIPKLVQMLQEGKQIAQVSDAGMPSISDPGFELVQVCIEEGISVVSIPGATAGVTALVASGIAPQPFLFYGFLPRKKKSMVETLEFLGKADCSLIFYESPYRVKGTLATMMEVFGEEVDVVLARELSKIHEEYIRGQLIEVTDYCQEHEIKGECCIILQNKGKEEIEEEWQNLSVAEHLRIEMDEEGLSSKDAIKKVAKLRKLKKQEVYKVYHDTV